MTSRANPTNTTTLWACFTSIQAICCCCCARGSKANPSILSSTDAKAAIRAFDFYRRAVVTKNSAAPNSLKERVTTSQADGKSKEDSDDESEKPSRVATFRLPESPVIDNKPTVLGFIRTAATITVQPLKHSEKHDMQVIE